MNMIKILPMIAFFIVLSSGCERSQKEGIKVISPEEARTAMASEEELNLIDVRTPEEFAEGNIPGAENINFFDEDFESQVKHLDKDEPVYIYCRSGVRSAKAAAQLQELGFKEIYDIEGGYMNWED